MPHDKTFEGELHELLAKKMRFEDLEPLVVELHKKHNRPILPPIIGTLQATDPEDKFSGT